MEASEWLTKDLDSLGKDLYYMLTAHCVWAFNGNELRKKVLGGKKYMKLDADVQSLISELMFPSKSELSVEDLISGHEFIENGREMAEKWPLYHK